VTTQEAEGMASTYDDARVVYTVLFLQLEVGFIIRKDIYFR